MTRALAHIGVHILHITLSAYQVFGAVAGLSISNFWNVTTLDLNVATLVLTTLWNVTTLDLNVAMLAVFLYGTSRRCIRMSRRWPCLRPKTPSFCSYPIPVLLEPYDITIVVPTTPHPRRIPLSLPSEAIVLPPTASPTLLPPFTYHHFTVPVSHRP